jgi:energy-coupling factor transporter ATP-binding protein EcfA2
MITLSINNFRGFQNQEIDLSKFNILIGENCSGKSSLIKLLLAMKQSLESPNDQQSNFTFSGDYSDLGSYHESVFNHQANRKISFKFKFHEDYLKFYLKEIPSIAVILEDDINNSTQKRILRRVIEKKSLGFLKNKIDKETTVEFQFTSELDKHYKIKTIFFNKKLGEVKIQIPKKSETRDDQYIYTPSSSCDISLKHFPSKKTYLLKNVRFDKSGFLSVIWGHSLRDIINQECKELDFEQKQELFYHLSYFFVTQNYITDFLKRIDYINPILSKPERIFFKGDVKRLYRQNNIEKVVKMLEKKKHEDSDFITLFSDLLADFGIIDDILLKGDSELPVQELKVKINDLWSNIADVGYGVALQLPILFEALYSENMSHENRIIIIEQPEVHIHPRLQAKLIEVLSRLNVNTSYIIETHSEHIVRKLQSIVKKGQNNITPEVVAITYFTKEKKQLLMQKHHIDKNGILSPKIPSGFFDSTYLLAKELIN